MKTVVKLFFGFLAIAMALVLVAYLLPREISVERSITIDAPQEIIYNQVNTLRNWEKWSPWHQIDPEMEITYQGPEAGAGATCFWKSDHNQVGNGSMTIITSKPFERIEVDMNFMESGSALAYYTFEKVENGTILTWQMHSDMGKNPLMRYMGLIMEKMIGDDFEEGLLNLKAHVEGMSEEKVNALLQADLDLIVEDFTKIEQ